MMEPLRDGHVTAEVLRALMAGAPDDAGAAVVAEHIAQCPRCAALMADAAADTPADPPRGLAENISAAITGAVYKKRREFYYYCVRIAACVALIVGLSFVIEPSTFVLAAPAERDIPAPAAIQIPEKDPRSTCEKLQDFFTGIYQTITNPEDTKSNDQTKK